MVPAGVANQIGAQFAHRGRQPIPSCRADVGDHHAAEGDRGAEESAAMPETQSMTRLRPVNFGSSSPPQRRRQPAVALRLQLCAHPRQFIARARASRELRRRFFHGRLPSGAAAVAEARGVASWRPPHGTSWHLWRSRHPAGSRCINRCTPTQPPVTRAATSTFSFSGGFQEMSSRAKQTAVRPSLFR